MANMAQLVCPSCGGKVALEKGPSECICEYCGKRVVFGSERERDDQVEPRCPQCQGELRFDLGTGTVVCGACGASFIIDETSPDLAKGVVPSQPEWIITFERDERQARREFVDWLGRGPFVIGDVYDRVKIEHSEMCYVPFYMFFADYKVKFTCEAFTGGKDGWIRRSGTVTGSCDVPSPAAQRWREYFDQEFKQCCANRQSSEFDSISLLLSAENAAKIRKPFDPHYVLGVNCDKFEESPRDTWPHIEHAVDRQIAEDIGGALGTQWRDPVYNPKHVHWNSTSIYLPMHLVQYSCGGEELTYFQVCDAGGYQCGARPFDKKTESRRFKYPWVASMILLFVMIMVWINIDVPPEIDKPAQYLTAVAIGGSLFLGKLSGFFRGLYLEKIMKKRTAGRERAEKDIDAFFVQK